MPNGLYSNADDRKFSFHGHGFGPPITRKYNTGDRQLYSVRLRW